MSQYPVLDVLFPDRDGRDSAFPAGDGSPQAAGGLHALSNDELKALCADIRLFLLEHISKTGGHLASNLGVVELTVALHMEFDTARDRILFDVGHQSYVHKLLSGRRDGFDTLRCYRGMSGFPKPDESAHDPFIAGHASTSVSVATGMARARALRDEDYRIVAVIGDGALTGGLAYEALNDAGRGGMPLIVILNDNSMSISPNVGAMANYLARLRIKPGYYKCKQAVRRAVGRLPGGKYMQGFFHRVKENLKSMVLPSTFFESMGFNYVGPVDGHDIRALREMISYAKNEQRPTLIHCKTVKGLGYKYSEERPERFHGTPEFDIASGETAPSSAQSFSQVFGDALTRLAREDQRICAVTAAMPAGTGLLRFAAAYPKRFFDVGIAEGHALTMAAGMAKQGMVPVCAVYSTFLQRAYDQIIHDIAISGLHVVLAVDRAGITGEDGETHQGVFDVSFLTSVPGMTVLCPASNRELTHALSAAVDQYDGPVAVRYPRGSQGAYTHDLSGSPASVVRRDADARVTLVTYGVLINEVLAAAELLATQGIASEIVKLYSIKPLDTDTVAASVSRTGRLVVAEECVPGGSVGERLLATLSAQGRTPRSARLLNIGEHFLPHGSVACLREACGLDAAGIARAAGEVCARG